MKITFLTLLMLGLMATYCVQTTPKGENVASEDDRRQVLLHTCFLNSVMIKPVTPICAAFRLQIIAEANEGARKRKQQQLASK